MRICLTLFSILMLSMAAMAQVTSPDLADFIGRKWVTTEYGIHGEKYPASDIPEGDGSTFLPDGTYRSVDKGIASKGKWSYDSRTRILTAHNEQNEAPTLLRVVSVGPEVTVMEAFHEGESAKAHSEHAMTIYLRVAR